MIEDSPSPCKKLKIVRRSGMVIRYLFTSKKLRAILKQCNPLDIIAAATAVAGPTSSPRHKQASLDHSTTDDSKSGDCDMEQDVDVNFFDFSSRSASKITVGDLPA